MNLPRTQGALIVSHSPSPRDPQTPPARTLLTVRQFAEKHSAFTQLALRSLIFNAVPRYCSVGGRRQLIAGNGLDRAILRLGRRVLIDEAEFFAWIDRRQAEDPRRPSTDRH
jgi:hypothetical protein